MNINEASNLIIKGTQDLIDLCPHCGAKVHIEKLWQAYHILSGNSAEFYVVFRCKPCDKLVLKVFRFRNINGSLIEDGWKEKFPISLDSELSKLDSENIPEEVFLDYEEALKCKSIGAHKASCSMFRRALQSGLVELGADETKNLVEQIESLESLPVDLKDWAHQIRIFGNWGAHPKKDKLKKVSKDDVEEVHDFVSKFFMYTFIMPSKVEASRARRGEKASVKK